MATLTVNERTVARFTGVLKDDLGNIVPGSSLTGLFLTLIDQVTDTVINSRDAQPVLNANDVTVDVNGVLTWSMQAADNIIVSPAVTLERHTVVFDARWGSNKRATFTETICVENVPRIT